MKKHITATIIFSLLILSCKSKPIARVQEKKHTFLDTVLVVKELSVLQTGKNNNLTDTIANQALQEYYSALGYGKKKRKGDDMCVMLDTLYKFHLNTDHYIDGIITYYDTPCFASGHCYQPSIGIVTYNKGKYRLVKANLLPHAFLIDSITQYGDNTYIYGGEFDCSENVYTRRYRARIEKSN